MKQDESPRRKPRRLDRFSLARLAYRRRDIELARAAHGTEDLDREPRDRGTRGSHLADAVLGATDGIVTTFAIVTGAAGAQLPAAVVIIMGFANLLADGFSMGVGNYLGARSQRDYWEKERTRELWEIDHFPDSEKKEVRRLYETKGFKGDLLDRAVETITADKRRWADEMMRDELGIQEEKIAPARSGVVTFAAFFLAGLLPPLSYAAAYIEPSLAASALPISVVLTASALFIVGALRSVVTERSWWSSGLEILAAGGLAAAAAFGVGYLLRGLAA
jgi:VIT1/CCC1 family predicted Fe2+/Mn2+ transporter